MDFELYKRKAFMTTFDFFDTFLANKPLQTLELNSKGEPYSKIETKRFISFISTRNRLKIKFLLVTQPANDLMPASITMKGKKSSATSGTVPLVVFISIPILIPSCLHPSPGFATFNRYFKFLAPTLL